MSRTTWFKVFKRIAQNQYLGANGEHAPRHPSVLSQCIEQDESVKKYSPHPMYQAGEFFALLTTTQDLVNSKSTRIHELFLARVGPWLPWMDMGEAKGYMMYTADGAKVANFGAGADSKGNRDSIAPISLSASVHAQEKERDLVTYFKAHTKAYLDGQTFPLPAPVVSEECAK